MRGLGWGACNIRLMRRSRNPLGNLARFGLDRFRVVFIVGILCLLALNLAYQVETVYSVDRYSVFLLFSLGMTMYFNDLANEDDAQIRLKRDDYRIASLFGFGNVLVYALFGAINIYYGLNTVGNVLYWLCAAFLYVAIAYFVFRKAEHHDGTKEASQVQATAIEAP
jgi:hypothetical protein